MHWLNAAGTFGTTDFCSITLCMSRGLQECQGLTAALTQPAWTGHAALECALAFNPQPNKQYHRRRIRHARQPQMETVFSLGM